MYTGLHLVQYGKEHDTDDDTDAAARIFLHENMYTYNKSYQCILKQYINSISPYVY